MQVHVLSLRFLRSWYRCPVNLAIQGAQYIFFALLIGEYFCNPRCAAIALDGALHLPFPDKGCMA